MTVATTVASLSSPRSCSASAQTARIASPSTSSPSAVTARQRSASPSWARPRSAPCCRDGLDERTEVGRADPVVDVPAVGLAPDGVHRRAGPPVDVGGDRGGRAVRAVDDERQAGERLVDGREQMRDVVVGGVGEVAHPADTGTGRPVVGGRAADDGALDRGLDGVGQLLPAPAEQLDAVVGHRVVTGRDHDAEIGVGPGGQVGQRGRRQDAGAQDLGAGAGQPGHDRGLEHLPAGAGVTADDRDGTPSPVAVGEHAGGGTRHREGQLRREVGVGPTPDAVGPEESAPHGRTAVRVSAWSTEEPCGPS